MSGAEQRVDKWLFFARVVKSRSLAQKLTIAGAVRINREKVVNPAKQVRPGDVLTVTLERSVRVLRVVDPGVRRGPASEAAGLYEDLTPPAPPPDQKATPTLEGYTPSPRPPTKQERRALERLRSEDD